jgi:hypothetical protein
MQAFSKAYLESSQEEVGKEVWKTLLIFSFKLLYKVDIWDGVATKGSIDKYSVPRRYSNVFKYFVKNIVNEINPDSGKNRVIFQYWRENKLLTDSKPQG